MSSCEFYVLLNYFKIITFQGAALIKPGFDAPTETLEKSLQITICDQLLNVDEDGSNSTETTQAMQGMFFLEKKKLVIVILQLCSASLFTESQDCVTLPDVSTLDGEVHPNNQIEANTSNLHLNITDEEKERLVLGELVEFNY